MTLRKPLSAKVILIVLFFVLSVLYIGFHGKYAAEYLDDAWTFSWAWNIYQNHIYTDTVFGGENSGTLFFQRTQALVYGAAASVLGWNRGVGYAVSKFFVVAAAACWFFIIRKLRFSKTAAWAFVGMMLLLEAYFGIANKIRAEPIPLFLCSLALLLFIHKRFLFSGLALGVAIEAHPFAITGGFWALGYLISILPEVRRNFRLYIKGALLYALGLGLGFLYWYWLHAPYISQLGELSSRLYSNVILAYYFTHRLSYRHWPELAMILLASVLFFVRRLYQKHPFVPWFLISVIAAALVMPRGNIHYIVYLYPAAILLLLSVSEELRLTPHLLVALMIFQLPQYAYLFYYQRNYNHREFLTRIKEEVPPGKELIYGNPNAWFAFKNRDFHSYGYFSRSRIPPEEWPDSFLLIETSDFQRWNGKPDIERGLYLFSKTKLSEWTYWDGKPITVYRMGKNH